MNTEEKSRNEGQNPRTGAPETLAPETLTPETLAPETLMEEMAQENLKTVMDEAPGGFVLFEYDGKDLIVLHMSRYSRELYGASLVGEHHKPVGTWIHPKDLPGYEAAFAKALAETSSLDYGFRVWDQKRDRYIWVRNQANVKAMPDGKKRVYALYSDVTEQKVAEARLEKSNAAIRAALGASEQFSYDFDPVAHTITKLADNGNGYFQGETLEQYPACMRTLGVLHPDDIEEYIAAAEAMENGEMESHCVVRLTRDGENYCWHSCTFSAIYDHEKDRPAALLTALDITPHVLARTNYERQLQWLLKRGANSICMGNVNLTKNHVFDLQMTPAMKAEMAQFGTFVTPENLVDVLVPRISKEADRQTFRKLFDRAHLLKCFEEDENHLQFETLYQETDDRMVWAEFGIDLVADPLLGDVIGICYGKDRTRYRAGEILLRHSLEKDYPVEALVFTKNEEYYLYASGSGAYCEHKVGFWNAVNHRLARVVVPEDLAEVQENLSRAVVLRNLEETGRYVCSFYAMSAGERTRIEATFRYTDETKEIFLVAVRNITDQELYAQYKYEGEHDERTGLLNRKTVFAQAKAQMKAHPESQFVVLHCDVRRFHLFNTFFGEKAGDRLLCDLADQLRQFGAGLEYWRAGRIESDVFCACFAMDWENFERKLKDLVTALENLRDDFPLMPRIGLYWVTDPSMSMEVMFTRATMAGRSRKNNLFGVASRYDGVMEQELQDLHRITSETRHGLAQEEFEVYLQPKVNLSSEKVAGAEALVRWNHPTQGLIPPGKFIPALEQDGRIAELDRYMWEHVCRILQRWQNEGRPMLPVSVNISRVSIYSHATVPFLKELIAKYRIDPKYLELELTETAYMDDPTVLKRILSELQAFGFKILMDDFGSGYSSMNALRELPVNILKLDMQFLAASEGDYRTKAVLSSVVRMGKLLNLPVVAEGVEKREQADYLRSIGCEYGQGYLFARPMPVAEYEKLLDTPEKIDIAR